MACTFKEGASIENNCGSVNNFSILKEHLSSYCIVEGTSPLCVTTRPRGRRRQPRLRLRCGFAMGFLGGRTPYCAFVKAPVSSGYSRPQSPRTRRVSTDPSGEGRGHLRLEPRPYCGLCWARCR